MLDFVLTFELYTWDSGLQNLNFGLRLVNITLPALYSELSQQVKTRHLEKDRVLERMKNIYFIFYGLID